MKFFDFVGFLWVLWLCEWELGVGLKRVVFYKGDQIRYVLNW